MRLVSLLSGRDLLKEKQKDYRNVVITQILIIVLGLVISGALPDHDTMGKTTGRFAISIFLGFGTVYNFLLWDLLRNFSKNRTLLVVTLFILSAITLTAILTEFPYYKVIEVSDRRTLLFVFHIFLFPVEVIVISYTILDIFTGEFLTPDKLWGSACVFLMSGISFGSLYDLICIGIPNSLGVDLALGFPNYSECISYSFRMLTGMDSSYQGASRLVQNISVIEAIWGNLFTVLIIGKLLGLPKLESQQSSINKK